MKNLLTLLMLATGLQAGAQSLDLYVTGGLHSDKPTKASYTEPIDPRIENILQPYRSEGYYFGLGGGWILKKGIVQKGVQLELDYITYMMTVLNYSTYKGLKFPGYGIVIGESTRYIRVAPSFTLSRRFAGFSALFAIGPDYNSGSSDPGGFVGGHAGLRFGFKGFSVNAGYAMGFGGIPLKDKYKDFPAVKSRAFNVGLSLHPLDMFR